VAKIRLDNIAAGLAAGAANYMQGVAAGKQFQHAEKLRKEAEAKTEKEKGQARTDRANAFSASAFNDYLEQFVAPPPEALQRRAQIASGEWKPPQTFPGYPAGHDEVFDAEGLQGTPDPTGFLAGLPAMGETRAAAHARLAKEAADRAEAGADKRHRQTMRRDKHAQSARVNLEKLRSAAQLQREQLRQNPKLAKDKGDYVFRMLKAYDDLGGHPEYRDAEREAAEQQWDTFVAGVNAFNARATPPVPVSPGRAVVDQFRRDTEGGLADPFGGNRPRTSGTKPAPWLEAILGTSTATPEASKMPPAPTPIPIGGREPVPSMGTPSELSMPPLKPVPGAERAKPTAAQKFPLGTAPQAKLQKDLAGAYASEKAGDLAGAKAADVPKAAADRTRRTDSYVSHNENMDEVAIARQALAEKQFDHKKWYDKANTGIRKMEADARMRQAFSRQSKDPAQQAAYREWSGILTQIGTLKRQMFSFQGGRERKQAVAATIQQEIEGLQRKADRLRPVAAGDVSAKTAKAPPNPQQAKLLKQYPGMKELKPADVKVEERASYAEFEQVYGVKPNAEQRRVLDQKTRQKLKVPPAGTGGY
jgi:hypothetical protein